MRAEVFTMLSSLAASIGGSLASAGISKLLGGKKSKGQAFSGGGYNFSIDKRGTPSISTSAQRTAAVNNISDLQKLKANELRGLIPGLTSGYNQNISALSDSLSKVNPGFGDVTKARVDAVLNQGMKASSDLRSNLAKRRVLGSSFANDEQARTAAEFAKQEADTRAKSFLEELDYTMKLIDQRYTMQRQQVSDTTDMISAAFSADLASNQVQLDEMNSQLNALLGIMGNAQNVAAQNAQVEQQRASMVSGISTGFGNLVSGWMSSSGLTGGFDPYTGITWNSGRV